MFSFSSLYQAISHIDGGGIRSGAGDDFLFEPLLLESLAHFSKIIKAYKNQKFKEGI